MIEGERLYLLKQEAELYDTVEGFLKSMKRSGDSIQELTEIWNIARV